MDDSDRYTDQFSVTETSSYVVVNVQQALYVHVLWVVYKSDIDSAGSSVHRLLKISQANSQYFHRLYEFEEHSHFGLVFAGAAYDSGESSSFATFLMEWNIGADTIKRLDIQGASLIINSFAIEDLGGDVYGVMISSHNMAGVESTYADDAINPTLVYGTVDESVVRGFDDMIYYSWVKQV